MALGPVTSFIVEIGKDILSICYLILYGIYAFIAAPFQALIPCRLKSIDKEIVLVVGRAGSNLFVEVCRQIAKTNAKLIIWYDDAGGLQQQNKFLDNLRNDGAQVFSYEVNLCDRNSLETTAKRTKQEAGDVSVIINIPDLAPAGELLDQSVLEIEKTFDTNLLSQFWILREFLPKMAKGGHGHIVSICSPARSWGCTDFVPYIGTRSAIQGLIESLEDEVIHHMDNPDIKFTMIIPSLLRTDLFEGQYILRYPSLFPLLDDEKLAKSIVEGFRRNRDIVYVPTSFGFLLWIESLVPIKFIKKLQNHLFIKVKREGRHA